MDPVVPTVALGIVGGFLIAWVLLKVQRQQAGRPRDPFARGQDGSQRDVINISAIRVAGVGGLGLVAMAVGVALDIPRIGQTLAIAGVLGAVLAAVLILQRRRMGPMPSSGRQSGANTTLAIDQSGKK